MSLQPLENNLSALPLAADVNSEPPADGLLDQPDAFELTYELLIQQSDCDQLIVRRQDAESEIIFGFVSVVWPADLQTAVVHLPIIPAFAAAPAVEVQILDGAARVRVTDCQRFGVRVELIRGLPCSAPATMRLGFTLAVPQT